MGTGDEADGHEWERGPPADRGGSCSHPLCFQGRAPSRNGMKSTNASSLFSHCEEAEEEEELIIGGKRGRRQAMR